MTCWKSDEEWRSPVSPTIRLPMTPQNRRKLFGRIIKAAEAALIGKKLSDDEIRQSASLAAQEAQPTSDLRGTAEYKREMVRTLAARALRRAVERARGET